MTTQTTTKDRVTGVLIGLAVGDALGGPVEFMSRGSFEPITDYRAGGAFSLAEGEWTDDTSMALCLGQSLLNNGGFDAYDQLQAYVAWMDSGYMSTRDHCFDIGVTTSWNLRQFKNTGVVKAPHNHMQEHASNGSIMRLGPVPMFYHDDPELALLYSAESSVTTHSSRVHVEACTLLAAITLGGIHGLGKEEILSTNLFRLLDLSTREFTTKVKETFRGSYKRDHFQPGSSSAAISTLESALWAFHNSESFLEGALLAVNLGGDSDTIGAVYGQIAGAFYGRSGIPTHLIERLVLSEWVTSMADSLYENSHNRVPERK